MLRSVQVLAWVLLLGNLCLAETITVDDDDPCADFSSIQDAIDYAWDGDVAEVRPGYPAGDMDLD